jgi:hypothetical protein
MRYFGSLPVGQPGLDFFGGQVNFQDVVWRVKGDYIAVAKGRDRAANLGFRGDMPNHQAMSTAREASVGNQGDILAQTLPNQGSGYGQHFAHTRAAFRPFIANYHHVSGYNFILHDCVKGGFLTIKDFSRAGMDDFCQTGDFADSAFRGQVAAQDYQRAGREERVIEPVDDLLVRS